MQPGYSVPKKNLGANVQGRPVYNPANATVGGGGAMPQGQGQGRPPYNPGPSASAAPGAMPQGNQPVYNPASTAGAVPPGQGRPVPYNPAIATAATMSPGRPVVYNPGTTPGTMQPGRPVAYNPANTGTIPGRGYPSTQPPIQQQQTMQTGFNQNSTIPNQNTISGIQKNMNTSMNMPPIAMMGNVPRGHGPANFPPTDNRIPPQQGPPQQAGFPNQPGSFIPPSSMNALRGPPKTFSPRTIMPPPTSIPPPPSSGVEQNLAQSVDAFSQMSLNGPGGSSVDYPPRGMPQQTRAPVAQNNTMASGAYNQMDAYNRVGGPSAQAQPPALSEQAMASQCKPIYMKPTVSAIPYSADQGSKSQLSFGVTIRPLAPATSEEDEVDLVNFGSAAGVVRCKRCRTYMNPFVQWIDNGRRWRCNVCNSSNDVPSAYFCHLGQDQQRTDRAQRPELCKGSCEIVAPQEYMMRPPQPPVYVFVIDVSVNAIQNGVLQSVVDTLKTVLVELPGAPRTRVGFVTFDSSVHFYNLKSTLKQPQMMVVPDITELFIPIPDDLLVNLSESRDIIDSLLNLLPSLHKNSRNIEVALGPAIRAAFRVMSTIGGKMCVFLSSLPSLGQGALSHRENPRLLGTEKENTLINSVDNFYRQNAIEFCRQQVSVDMFLTPTQYMDIATIGCLTKYSAGQLFYYPGFSFANDGEKLREELRHCLRRETGWEAVLRVRCTQGMRIANYYGNSFLRGPDLLALPNINADASFAIEIVHSDAVLTTNIISIQAALLYTASCGERRIRVHNLAIPVVKMLSDVFRSVDINTLCNLIAKTALETAIKSGFDAARNKLQMQCADIIRAYRLCGAYMSQHVGMNQLNLPESLQLLPLYTMALMKNPAFRGGTDIRPDERTFTIYQINNMFVEQSIIFIYPRLYSLTNLTDNCGLPDSNSSSNDTIVLPPILNLSIERFSSSEAFLLEDGLTIWLWIGRAVESSFLLSVFGVPTLDGMDCSQLNILSDPKDDIGRRVKNIVSFIRKQRLPYMKLCVIKEGEPGENRVSWKLVEDRASFNGGSYSYAEFLAMISKQSFAPPAVSK